MMSRITHEFHKQYSGPIGFGMDRDMDEASLVVYVQRFSNDRLMKVLKERLSEGEIHQVVDFLTGIMKRHLSDEEYHELFLVGSDE